MRRQVEFVAATAVRGWRRRTNFGAASFSFGVLRNVIMLGSKAQLYYWTDLGQN
jgi:hypothetical protein